MNEQELDYLKEYAGRRARQLALEATVTYGDSDGFIIVEVIKRAGGGQPISIKRTMKYLNRVQAEAFVDDILGLARRAGAPR